MLLTLVAGDPADYSLIATDILQAGKGLVKKFSWETEDLWGNTGKDGRKRHLLSRVYKFRFYGMILRIKIPHEDKKGL